MPITDDELARAKNISVEQVRLLQTSRGASNDTLDGLSEDAVRRALRRLSYPDLARERLRQRLDQERSDDGQVPADPVAVAVAGRSRLAPARSIAPAPSRAGGLAPTRWQWLGPGNIGGRTRGVVIDPADPDRMWAASAGGGVWHTADGGTSWAPVDDFLANLACSCITQDAAGRILVGTGEGFGNLDALRGGGIFASTDTVTWTRLPATAIPDFHFVNRLAVSPSRTVLLAATASGIQRSSDAERASWTRVLPVATGDVRFDPTSSLRAVAGAVNAGEAWFTRDGGRTWRQSTHGPWSGRVELAYAAADPSIVYASVQAAHGEIWRSTDGGQSYQPRQTKQADGAPAPYLGDQGWYDNAIWAGDPTNADLVVVGGIDLWRSTNGGNTLAEISTWWDPRSAHADQHVIVSHPGHNGAGNRIVLVGNDGGVFRADLARVGGEPRPPFVRGWRELVNNYGVTQFYGGAGSTISGKIIGGAQDNGTLCLNPADGPEGWTTIFGGDGGWCAADPVDPKILYGEYVFLNIHRNTDGGATDDTAGDRYISGQFWNPAAGDWQWKPVPFQIPDARLQKALFIAPFVLDPNQRTRLLAGGQSLWRTDDALTPNTTSTGPSWREIKTSAGEPISAIAVAPTSSDTIWVGHRNGMVFRTDNGTAATPSWQRVGVTGTAPLRPQRYCTGITVDPADADTVVVTFGGYEPDNVWTTRDGGRTWAPPPAPLPPAPVRAMTVHPRRGAFRYLGTEVGVLASEDGGASWFPSNDGPANCPVDDLFWMGETLVCVTHGRGMFRIDLSGV